MENIKVAVCVRGDGAGVLYDEEKKTAQVHCLTYSFDYVFGPPLDPVYIYDKAISSLVDRVMSGYNACLFPWGTAGTGKTQMMDALSQLVVERLFKAVEHKRHVSSTNPHFLIHASVLEICDVDILDLLARKEEQNSPLQMRGDDANVYLDNITLVETMCPDHLYNVFELARKRRNMPRPNVSERHAIYTIIVESSDSEQNNATKDRHVGRLNLIDILGEKKDPETPNVVTGAVMQIVNSLITAQRHVPYQASILTKLMQDALGGNCATLMLGCVDAGDEAVTCAAATLRFAARIMKVQNVPKLNVAVESKLAQYEDELDALKDLYDKQTARDVDQNWRLDVLRKISTLESRIQGAVSTDALRPELNGNQSPQALRNGASPQNQSSHADYHQAVAAQHGTDETAYRKSPTVRGVTSVAFHEQPFPPQAPILHAHENEINGTIGNLPDKERQEPLHEETHPTQASPIDSKKKEFDSLLEHLYLTNEELRVAKNMLQVRTEQLNDAEEQLHEMKKRESLESLHSDLLPATIDELVNVLVQHDPSGRWLSEISAPVHALLSAQLGTDDSDTAQTASEKEQKPAPPETLTAARTNPSTSTLAPTTNGENVRDNVEERASSQEYVTTSTSRNSPHPRVEYAAHHDPRSTDTSKAGAALPPSNLSTAAPAPEPAQRYRFAPQPTRGSGVDVRRANSAPRVAAALSQPKLLQNPPWAMVAPPTVRAAAQPQLQQQPPAQRNTSPHHFGPFQHQPWYASDGSKRERSVSPLPTGKVRQLQPHGALNVSGDGQWSVGRMNLAALTLTKRDLSPMSSRHKSPIIRLHDAQAVPRLRDGLNKPNVYGSAPNYPAAPAQSQFGFPVQNVHHHSARAPTTTNAPAAISMPPTNAPNHHLSARTSTTSALAAVSSSIAARRSLPVPQKPSHRLSGLHSRGASGITYAVPGRTHHPFGTGAGAYSGVSNPRSRVP